MTSLRTGAVVVARGGGLAGLLAGDAAIVGATRLQTESTTALRNAWTKDLVLNRTKAELGIR